MTFTDGRSEEVDEIIAATGYRHGIPYATDVVGPGRPDLYLTAFSREHEGLFAVGLIETNSGAFGHLDGVARMVAAHLDDRVRDPERYRCFRALVRTDRPDLSGGIRFDGSPRHEGYVDADAFSRYRRRVVDRMGWSTPVPAPASAQAGARPST